MSLISSCCHNLLELELKNAWLSVNGLTPMSNLKCLTLEVIRLDDEDLCKTNDCFPSLESLKLIGVGGLKEPKVHLLRLKACQWIVSNAPISLTVFAPKIITPILKCCKPKSLILDTPMLSGLLLSMESANGLQVKEFPKLRDLGFDLRSSHCLRSFRISPFLS